MQFAVIGCGRISQIMHLPYLDELPDAEIHAIADPAPNVRERVASKFRVPERYADGINLVEAESDVLDGVVIATPPQVHREVAIAALEADINTFVEKPLALTPGDATAMTEAAAETDAISMVGYMKRHDPTYLLFRDHVQESHELNRVVGTLVLGQHDEVIDEIYDLVAPELSDSFLQESNRRRTEQAATALGTDDPDATSFYQSHLSASCHDLSALRGLLGEVERIDHVDIHSAYNVLSAHLIFEGDRRCLFTSSFNQRKEWEEFIRVETPTQTLTLEFTNPYVKNDPFTLHVKRGEDRLESLTVQASYEESFKAELEHFLSCIGGETAVRTPFSEGRDDVQVFVDLFRKHLGTV